VAAVPLSLIIIAPWSVTTKALLISGMGLAYALIAYVCVRNVFSEEKWLKASGFQELMESLNTNK
jgi:hypothetical protein